jgi:ferredoxin
MAFLDVVRQFGPKASVTPEDERGRLDLMGILGTPRAGVGIYVCGPTGLLDAIEQCTADWPADALHVERFEARARPDDEANEPFVAECARSQIEVLVPAKVGLLTALEGAGIRLPNACRDGVCGSCEVGVRAGEVDHRDSVLSAAERTAGDRMLACVSRAAGERLVLDL